MVFQLNVKLLTKDGEHLSMHCGYYFHALSSCGLLQNMLGYGYRRSITSTP
jgi:hypothetical protein